MKRTLIILAAAATALTACSRKELVADKSPADVIAMRTVLSGPTKAEDITTGTLSEFEVTAMKGGTTPTQYFADVVFTKNGSEFASDSPYYWPASGTLDFYAYAPLNNDQVAKTDYKTFTVTPLATVAEQVDFIYANTNGKDKEHNGSAGVTMNFRHTQSKIAVKVKNSNPNLKFVVDGWKMGYLSPSGKFSYATAKPADPYKNKKDENTDTQNSAQLNVWDWSELGAATIATEYSVPLTSAKEFAAADGTPGAESLGGAETEMILVPQATAAAMAYASTAADAKLNGTFIGLKIKILNPTDGSVIYSGSDGESTAWAVWPVSAEWTPGKKYTYIVDLAGGGYYETNRNGTDEKLDPILAGATVRFTTVTVDEFSAAADIRVTAYPVTVTSNNPNMGTVSVTDLSGNTIPGTDGQYMIDWGTQVKLIATPEEGYGFAKWSDGNTDNPRTITVSGAESYQAEFAESVKIMATATNKDHGTVSIDGGEAGIRVESDKLPDSSVTLTATAEEGFEFYKWIDKNGYVEGATSSYTFEVTEARTVKALFKPADTNPIMANLIPGGYFSIGTDADGIARVAMCTKGNLQAVLDRDYDVNGATSSDHPTWQFAANQWDCIGNAAGNSTFKSGTTIDLFGWSSTESTKAVWGISRSKNNADYGNSKDASTFKDWGKNIDDKGTYRTLSKDEYVYLISTREFNSSAKGEGNSYQRVTLTGHGKGLLIYRDGYTGQVDNTLWEEISAIPSGCIFLPAAGYRNGSSVSNVGSTGSYWSASPDGATYAYYLAFSGSDVGPSDGNGRYGGRSVRLFSEL